MAEWFVFHDGTESGPFSNEAFLAFLKGKDPATIHIWREGLEGWVLAETLPSLVAAMTHAVPAVAAKPKPIAAAPKESKTSASQAPAVPWPTVSPRDRAEQNVDTGESTASAERSTSIAISTDDRFPDAGEDDAVARRSMWNWAQYGSLVGVIVGLVDVFYFRRGSLPAQGYIGAIFYFLGYVAACAAPFALLGLIAGAIRDRFRKSPQAVNAPDEEIAPAPSISLAADARPPSAYGATDQGGVKLRARSREISQPRV